MNQSYLKLIFSEKVTEPTKKVLIERLSANSDRSGPTYLSSHHRECLRRVIDLMLPQASGIEYINIGAILEREITLERGDGWRYADMPADKIALQLGLDELDRTSIIVYKKAFLELDLENQQGMLASARAGKAWTGIDSARWFEGLIAQATEIYCSDISMLAKMGFSGIAFLPAWRQIGLDQRQTWESTGP